MKIVVKVGGVEVRYEKDENPECKANAATCKEEWSGSASNEVLLRTISLMCKEAKNLHVGD